MCEGILNWAWGCYILGAQRRAGDVFQRSEIGQSLLAATGQRGFAAEVCARAFDVAELPRQGSILCSRLPSGRSCRV